MYPVIGHPMASRLFEVGELVRINVPFAKVSSRNKNDLQFCKHKIDQAYHNRPLNRYEYWVKIPPMWGYMMQVDTTNSHWAYYTKLSYVQTIGDPEKQINWLHWIDAEYKVIMQPMKDYYDKMQLVSGSRITTPHPTQLWKSYHLHIHLDSL